MSGKKKEKQEPVEQAATDTAAEKVEASETAQQQPAAEESVDLVAELDKAKAESLELRDKMLRMAAEQENFKKRMQRERENALKYAEEDILKELLPTLDNLQRAIEQGHGSSDASVLLEGVEMTSKGLLNTLEKFGLKAIDKVGEPFDPNFHEALAAEHSDDVPENMILQEYQRGYMFKDRLIRAAKVVVSKGKADK